MHSAMVLPSCSKMRDMDLCAEAAEQCAVVASNTWSSAGECTCDTPGMAKCPSDPTSKARLTSVSRSSRPSLRSWMVANTFCFKPPSASAALSPTRVSSCALLRSNVAACSSSTLRVISEMSSSAEVLSWSACSSAASYSFGRCCRYVCIVRGSALQSSNSWEYGCASLRGALSFCTGSQHLQYTILTYLLIGPDGMREQDGCTICCSQMRRPCCCARPASFDMSSHWLLSLVVS